MLQTFHKAKAHKGSPLRALDLKEVLGIVGPSISDPRQGKRSADQIQQGTRDIVMNWEVST